MMVLTCRLFSRFTRTAVPRRLFFASTTDHTTLLANAEVHCLPQDNEKKKQFVLVASGTETDLVKRVPQLHLARIWLDPDSSTIYGAKVVNKTLGEMSHVCGRLVDSAMAEGGTQARSTLHGLSEWVQSEDDDAVVQQICAGDMSCYEEGKEKWERFAQDFVNAGLGEEATLYQEKGGTFLRVEHRADKSEFANTSGEAMAIFQLK